MTRPTLRTINPRRTTPAWRLARGIGGALLLAGLSLAVTGCDGVFQTSHSRAMARAEEKVKTGDYREAVLAYEAALDGSPKFAEAHYQLALLYDGKLRNPVSAMHHYQRYLDLAPRGGHARDARRFLKEDEQKVILSLSQGALMTQDDAARLKNENLKLHNQLTAARKQITEMQNLARANVQKAGKNPNALDAKPKPIPPGAKIHTVEPGDTLASISRKHFKTSSRWKDIQEANFDTLEGTVKLKPGMTLMIPAK